ncbi:hypothetical protein ACG2F4_08790, partial [Halalkalibaculum sp. DA3122]|uniref:hypothetical protein n=1 Tax=unclassified Halalkalibaculum TaxID=2964617 RepID=UPI003754D2F5
SLQSVTGCEMGLSAALKDKSPAQRTNVRLRGPLPFALLKNQFLGEKSGLIIVDTVLLKKVASFRAAGYSSIPGSPLRISSLFCLTLCARVTTFPGGTGSG